MNSKTHNLSEHYIFDRKKIFLFGIFSIYSWKRILNTFLYKKGACT